MSYTDIKEPSCEHDSKQPASACRVCKDSIKLAEWKAYWHGRRDAYEELNSPKVVPQAGGQWSRVGDTDYG